MQGKRTRWWSSILGTATALVLVGIAPAGLATSRITLSESGAGRVSTDGDWVYREYQTALVGSKQREYRGRRTSDGGCRYSGGETIAADAVGTWIEREVAHNLGACRLITETGRPLEPEPAVDGTDSLEFVPEPTATAESQAPSSQVGSIVAQAASTKSAWHKTYFEDPVFIDVNSAKTFVTWTYNGSCVTSSSGHKAQYGWYTPTGWRLDWQNFSSSRNCSGAISTSNSHFSNGAFCATIDTHTEYVPNKIRGNPSGSYSLWWDANKWGGCNWLLAFKHSWGSS